MLIETVIIPKTEVVLATIIYGASTLKSNPATEFVTNEDSSIQVGILNRTEGTFIKTHQHLPTQKTVSGCQEVLIVKSGIVRVEIFDLDQNLIKVATLTSDDILIQYRGGHSFKFLADTQFVEIKQGPYTPQDKVFFVNPLAHECVK